jgi:hypothetical protein
MLETRITIQESEKPYPTGGRPILFLCDDLNTWVCKHGRNSNMLLFNEIIGSRFASIWGIRTPEICLINVNEEHLPKNYLNVVQPAFFRKPCFGSKYIEHSTVLDFVTIDSLQNLSIKSKIAHKEDFLLIGLFDIWLCNDDRHYNNMNLLLDFSEDEIHFSVFDHDAIFNSSSLRHGLELITEEVTIINTDLTKILFNRNRNLEIVVDKIVEKFYLCVQECEIELTKILNDIPPEWGLDLADLERLIRQELFDEEWEEKCETQFRTFIQSIIK